MRDSCTGAKPIGAGARRLLGSARGRSCSRTGTRSASRSTATRSSPGWCWSRTTRTSLDLPSLGERERLDEGKLHLYTPGADPPERVGERFVVDAAAQRLEAAVDGEPDVLETPVEFRVEPRALRVLVPPAESG